MQVKYTREDCISLLCDMQKKLVCAGETRYPKRSDFSEPEAAAIKAFCGPWPRALEAAGLKEKSEDAALAAERRREKRIIAKRQRNLMRKNAKIADDKKADDKTETD